MIDIVWSTSIDPSGYSSCARSYVKSLYQNPKCKSYIFVTNVAKNINSQGIDTEEISLLSKISIDNYSNFKYVVQHSVPDRFLLRIDSLNVCYTITEMPIIKRWIKICNQMDCIMTASKFSRDHFVESGVDEDKIHVIPHCHDTDVWSPSCKGLKIDNLKGFNFLFMGDYTPRKNGDLLIESYLKAFQGNKDVSLTIKAYYNSFSLKDQKLLIERISKIVEKSKIPKNEIPKILFYGKPIDECLMPNFMNSFDCLVSPQRGEGWGLAMSQMMCLEKPVISTNYSGNLEFMNDENSLLIDIDGFEDVSQEMVKINPNYSGLKWPRISQENLIEQMRYAYYNREEMKLIGERARKDMVLKFSSKIISDKIIDLCESL